MCQHRTRMEEPFINKYPCTTVNNTSKITTTNSEGEPIGTYDYVVQHVRNPLMDIRNKTGDWQSTSDQWLISINDVQFEFYTGIGNRKKIDT